MKSVTTLCVKVHREEKKIMNASSAGGKHRATELDLRMIVEFCETLKNSSVLQFVTASQADFRQILN